MIVCRLTCADLIYVSQITVVETDASAKPLTII